MKKIYRVLLFWLIITTGTHVFAAGLQMEKISVTTKQTEDEDAQNWLYFTSYTKSDWLSMRLFGKLYFPQLDDKYEDTSRDGLGDLYSGVRAYFKFPELSRGFKSTLGYKWNEDYRIVIAGAGYDWKLNRLLTMGIWGETAERAAGSSGSDTNNYERQKQEFTLNYNPKKWSYDLTLTRSDYNYPDADNTNYTYDSKKKVWQNEDYSVLSYTMNHKLNWRATSRINLGVGYRRWTSDYYHDQEGTHPGTTQAQGKKDGDGKKVAFDATYVPNQNWTWDCEYSRANSDGDNGTTASNYLGISGKYQPSRNWSVTPKLRFYDLDYSEKYQAAYEDPEDKDADYSSRRQQVLAVDYQRKLKTCSYGIEPFLKNYNYTSATKEDSATCGVIGTLEWRWANLDWYLLAAPEGTLSTRKGVYLLRAQYRF
jgi:hypothetical protein